MNEYKFSANSNTAGRTHINIKVFLRQAVQLLLGFSLDKLEHLGVAVFERKFVRLTLHMHRERFDASCAEAPEPDRIAKSFFRAQEVKARFVENFLLEAGNKVCCPSKKMTK